MCREDQVRQRGGRGTALIQETLRNDSSGLDNITGSSQCKSSILKNHPEEWKLAEKQV